MLVHAQRAIVFDAAGSLADISDESTNESMQPFRIRDPGSHSTSAGPTSRSPTAAARPLTVPFEVWKRPDELGRAIAGAAAILPAFDRAAVTMTAELCDCYPTKAVGVGAVLDAVVEALPGLSHRGVGHRRRVSLGG